ERSDAISKTRSNSSRPERRRREARLSVGLSPRHDRPGDVLFVGLAEELGMKIGSVFGARLLLFDDDSVRVRPGVVARARELPGDLRSGNAALDPELVRLDPR